MALTKIMDSNGNWINMEGIESTVIDNLSSTSSTDALSAKQGKVLNEKIDLQDGRLGNVIGMQGWNQLCPTKSEFSSDYGMTIVSNGDGSFTISGVADTTFVLVIKSNLPINGHKVYCKANYSTSYRPSDCGIMVQILGSGSEYKELGSDNGFILNCSNSGQYNLGYYVTNTASFNVTIKPQLIDLTTLFGEGNEPATVEEFRKLFPADYYPYCQGTMDLLWTNASPTSEFAAQTIYPTSMTDYYSVKVVFKSIGGGVVKEFKVGENWGYQSVTGFGNTGTYIVTRQVHTDYGGLYFGDCYVNELATASNNINNACLIPYQVYGIK